MRVALLFFSVLLLDPPAFADSVAPPPPPGAVAKAPDGGLVISSQTCAVLKGDAGVPSADYQPGVDVNGNSVAPADLGPSNSSGSGSSPTIDNFPIEIDQYLAKKFNLPPGTSPKAILGYVTVRNNQAYFNGQPLNADQNAALNQACNNAKH